MNKTLTTTQPLKSDKLSVDMPSQYLVRFSERGRDSWFVKKEGLLWKMERLYKAGNFAIQAEPVIWAVPRGSQLREIEYAGKRIPCAEEYALWRARIYVNGLSQPFIDYGEANPRNTRNPQMLANLNHLASTRASNRAMRLATACGFCSLDEREDVGSENHTEAGREPKGDEDVDILRDALEEEPAIEEEIGPLTPG